MTDSGTPEGQPVLAGWDGPQAGPVPGAWSLPSAPQPGAIPLRPLGLGEIYNGAIASMRQSPAASFAIAAALSAMAGLVTALVSLQVDHVFSQGGLPARGASAWLSGISQVLGLLINLTLAALLALPVGRAMLGSRTGLGAAMRLARPRLPALLGTIALLLVIYFGLWIPFGLLLAAVLATGSSAVVLLLVLLGLATLACEVAAWNLLGFATSVVLLERLGPARSLRRSWQLVRSSFWRVLGIQLLAAIIYLVAAFLITLPFAGSELALVGYTTFHVTVLIVILQAIGAVVAGTVVRPFLAGTSVLLYLDTRMRREGLDLSLRQVTSRALTADDFAGQP
jgi:hypothetical protein